MKIIKPGAIAEGAPVAPVAGSKKKRLILVVGAVAIAVIGVAVLMHKAPPAGPAPITVDTVPAHERVSLAHPVAGHAVNPSVAKPDAGKLDRAPIVVHPSRGQVVGTPALHPAAAASAVTMVDATPASTGSAVTVFPQTRGLVGAPVQTSSAAPAPSAVSAPSIDVPAGMPSTAEAQVARYSAAMYFSQESALQRKLRILELEKKIASTQHDIDKLKNDSPDADGGVVLPPPVAITPPPMSAGAKPLSTLTIKGAASTAAALAVPAGVSVGNGNSSNAPAIVSIMGVGNSYEAVVRVNGSDYAVRQGQMAGSWRVSRITSNAVDLSQGHQAMRLSF
jgi:type IV pilus biogenesis protein PilP